MTVSVGTYVISGMVFQSFGAHIAEARRVQAPKERRFLQRDPLSIGNLHGRGAGREYTDGLSLYVYVRRNPIVGNDPTGLCCLLPGGYAGGNYCGRGNCDPEGDYTLPPADCVDAACRMHDYCYDVNDVGWTDPPWAENACAKKKCDAMLCDMAQGGLPGEGPCNPPLDVAGYRFLLGGWFGCLILPPADEINCPGFVDPFPLPPIDG